MSTYRARRAIRLCSAVFFLLSIVAYPHGIGAAISEVRSPDNQLVTKARPSQIHPPMLFGIVTPDPDTLSTLVRIAPGTGDFTVVGSTGFEDCTGLDFSANQGLYATCQRPDGSNTHILATLDPVTGAGQEIGPSGILSTSKVSDIAFHPVTDVLYGYVTNADRTGTLVTFHLQTGAATVVGPTGVTSRGNGLAFTSAGLLYQPATGPEYPPAFHDLYTINPFSGQATRERPLVFPSPADFDPRIPGLDELKETGTLYALVHDGSDEFYLGTLATSSGQVSLIGPTAADLRGIALAPTTDLSVIKQCSSPYGSLQAIAGSTWFCSISVTAQAEDALGTVITDTVPVGLTYITDTSPLCALQPGGGPQGVDILVCEIGTLATGQTFGVTVQYSIASNYVANEPDGARTVTNIACASSFSGDLNPANNCGQDTDIVNDAADLKVTKLASSSQIQAGQVFTYSIFVDNLGPSDSRAVTLSDQLSFETSTEIIGIQSSSGTCTVTDPGAPPSTPMRIECALGNLPAKDRVTVTIALRSAEAQQLNNVALVAASTPDPNTSNNLADATVLVSATADLSVTQQVRGQVQLLGEPGVKLAQQTNAVTAGGLLTYTVNVKNNGPSTARNVTLQERLPPGIQVLQVTTNRGHCNPGTPGDPFNPYICYLGNLPGSISATIVIVARVPASLGGVESLYAEARVNSDTFDPNNLNSTAAITTTVNYRADLSVTLIQSPEIGLVGQIITYTLITRNAGLTHANGVTIVDALPDVLSDATWTCAASGGATCVAPQGTGSLSTTVNLPAGGQVHLTLTARVSKPGQTSNSASASLPNGFVDSYPQNNTSTFDNIPQIILAPLVLRGQRVDAPDLVITHLTANAYLVQVVIANQGSLPVKSGFWVDAYINPVPPPVAVNQVWPYLCTEGMVWAILGDDPALPLMPGGMITLTVNDSRYRADLSKVTWPLAEATVVYAQADSYNSATTYGAVLESHEISGGSYNNIAGPVRIATTLFTGVMRPVGALPDLEQRGVPVRAR